MSSEDVAFAPDHKGLLRTIEHLITTHSGPREDALTLPQTGLGEDAVIDLLAPVVLGGARDLGAQTAFAHMDPPTPWITWAMALWTASLNQNLLHPDVAPVARDLEARVIDWLAPDFGMDGGHMTPGSTVSNLTALWAARDVAGVNRVVSSETAHLSVGKAAHILGMDHETVPTDPCGRLDPAALPDDLARCALVLTAGTTSTGAIDPLDLVGHAAWTHVDAAWGGPLRFTSQYADRLAGVETADSIAISAHKWLFQPKESGLLFFRSSAVAHDAVSFGGAYLAVPNVGLLGSHGAVAVPLLATLLAWGRDGMAERINRTMAVSEGLAKHLHGKKDVTLHPGENNGVILWRPERRSLDEVFTRLPVGMASRTTVDGTDWIRHVAANPNADLAALIGAIDHAID